MRINWIEFENLDTGLIINKTFFNKELTLLVGRSGAGKTQILESISAFCRVATNDLSEVDCHFKGTISFSIDKDIFEWTVHVGKEDEDINALTRKRINSGMFLFFDPKETKLIIKSEKLLCNDNIIFDRNKEKLIMNGKELPLISNDFSLIYQYKNDDLLQNVYNCMNGLYDIDASISPLFSFRTSFAFLERIKSELTKCKTKDELRDSFPANAPSYYKLYLLKETNIKLYNILLTYYKNIFSDVDDFVFEIDYENQRLKTSVKTNDSLIPFNSISAGMRKTISFLVDLLTMSNNYVVLIDEIENGLGVNCLDEVYDLLMTLRNDLQLIITSHHPYIINNVNPDSCKIVDRKRNIISTYSAKELNLTNSHHDFYDLVMNKLQYGDIS